MSKIRERLHKMLYIRIPAVLLVMGAYVATIVACALPGELPAPGLLKYIGFGPVIAISVIMIGLHIRSIWSNWLCWRKTMFLVDTGLWTAWSVILYHDRRHFAALYALGVVVIAIYAYLRLPTGSERRNSDDHTNSLS